LIDKYTSFLVDVNGSPPELAVASASFGPTDDAVELCTAMKCIDGLYDSTIFQRWCSNFGTSTCQMAEFQLNPFLKLDLGGSTTVTRVVIYNRVDNGAGNAGLLGNHEVWVGDDASVPENNALCSSHTGITTIADVTVNHWCSTPLAGRYVYVYLPGDDRRITLFEVKVFAPSTVVQGPLLIHCIPPPL